MLNSGCNNGLHMLIRQIIYNTLSFSSAVHELRSPKNLQLMRNGGLIPREVIAEFGDIFLSGK